MRYHELNRSLLKWFFLVALTSLPLPLLAGVAAPVTEVLCTNELIRVTTQNEADKVHFFVQNLQSAEVTVTFEMEITHLTSNVAFPYTQTFAGGRMTKAFTLTRTDPKR